VTRSAAVGTLRRLASEVDCPNFDDSVERLLERVRQEPPEVTEALLELGARWVVSSVRSYGPADKAFGVKT